MGQYSIQFQTLTGDLSGPGSSWTDNGVLWSGRGVKKNWTSWGVE